MITTYTAYTAYNKSAEFGSSDYEGFPLSAKTDRSARIEAKNLAAEKGWTEHGIAFFRQSDGCRGEIDASKTPAKRGAPFQMTGAVRRNIFTDAESWATAQRIGNGNASLGIRLALAAYPGEK